MTTRPNTAAALAGLEATLKADMQARERERIEAKEQREAMAKDIAAIMANASKIDNRVTNIENDMKAVKPVIARVNSWQSMVMGAMVVFGMIGGMVTLFWDAVREKIGAWMAGG